MSQTTKTSTCTEYTPDQISLLKTTVAKGCSNDELSLFLHLANKYGLDPFAKEIWCIKPSAKEAALIMTARDGYLKIANVAPEFDGMTSGVVKAGDIFYRLPDGGVSHTFGDKRKEIIGAYSLVKRKDRSLDSFAWAEFNEYRQSTGTWNKYPSAMIMKVAESMALKRAFSISGIVTQEEIGMEPEANTTTKTAASNNSETAPAGKPAAAPKPGQVTDDIIEALEKTKKQLETEQAAKAATDPRNAPGFVKPSGQQVAVIKSLTDNPVFTTEERATYKKTVETSDKKKCEELIKHISMEIVKRQKANQTTMAQA